MAQKKTRKAPTKALKPRGTAQAKKRKGSTPKKVQGKRPALKKTEPAVRTKKPKKAVSTSTALNKKPSRRVLAVRPASKTTVAKEKKKLSPRERRLLGIRQNLIAQRNALLNEAEEALNALPGQTIFPDLGDQANAEIDRNFMLRLRGREQKLLKKIDSAIEKIESGSFGICETCGEEIDIKRLEARPVTSMCIFCKTEQEEEERLRGT